MRLICGMVRFDGEPVAATSLEAMIAALGAPGLLPLVTRRVDRSAALAVLRFERPVGELPSRDATLPVGEDGVWLAADARLDRPAPLAAELGLAASAPEHELLLAGARRWDLALPDRLDGDFALALWDPARARLLCARDIAGARPLCWAHEPGRWCAFASLPRGLHASGVVRPRPDLIALGRRFVELLPDIAETGYQDIAWLPAGHTLAVTASSTRVQRAWSPDPARVGTWRGTEADAAATLRTLIEDAVASRLPATGVVASDLSGGLDSSSVAVLSARALRARGRRLVAFSQLAAPRPGVELLDERRYVDAVLAQECDIVWSPVHLPAIDLDRRINVDLPGAIAGMMVPDITCAAAAAAGACLLLSGSGGDEGATYNGAGLHAALLRHGHWRALASEIPQWARRRRRSVTTTLLERVVGPLLPASGVAVIRRLRGTRVPPLRRDAALRLLAPQMARAVEASIEPATDFRNRPADRIALLTRGYLAPRATSWAIMGARHGVAFSHPLMDRRVLDFVLSLPLDRLASGGWTRQPFRDAMAGVLPDAIRWREHKFAPFPDAVLRVAEAKGRLLEHAAELRGRPAVGDFVDLDAVEAALTEIPDETAARAAARAANQPGGTPTIAHTMAAVRALAMARHVAALC
jgi:asparagine synthase (glutamine-hydrolysing)